MDSPQKLAMKAMSNLLVCPITTKVGATVSPAKLKLCAKFDTNWPLGHTFLAKSWICEDFDLTTLFELHLFQISVLLSTCDLIHTRGTVGLICVVSEGPLGGLDSVNSCLLVQFLFPPSFNLNLKKALKSNLLNQLLIINHRVLWTWPLCPQW